MSDPIGRLSELLVADIPSMPEAACVGSHDLFDPAEIDEDRDHVDQRHTAALQLCQACPALAACREWIALLPPRKRPGGVVAGAVMRSTGRPVRGRYAGGTQDVQDSRDQLAPANALTCTFSTRPTQPEAANA